MSMFFTKLHFLWHTTPDLWQSADQTVNALFSPNVNYMSSQWWVTWERWRVSAAAILPSEWCCGNTTRTGLQGGHLHSQAHHRLGTAWVPSTASHRIFYEDTSLSHLNWLRCFCSHSEIRCGWKIGKKYYTFPDCLYFSCILIYLICLHFKIAQSTKYKVREKLFCVRDLQLSSLTLLYKISRSCTSRISLQVMQVSNKK